MKYTDLLKISNPEIVEKKFKLIYPNTTHINISTRKNKKYMILNPHTDKYFHFGSNMQDYTHHLDDKRRNNFLLRNARWKDNNIYSAAYASYHLLR